MAHHIPIHNINEILLITNTSISQIGIVYRACLIYQLINICKCKLIEILYIHASKDRPHKQAINDDGMNL